MLSDLLFPIRFPAQRIRTILVLATLILSAAPAMAQVSWRMTTEYPENNISGIGLTTFADRVAARTNGFVTVTNAFDNQLKISSGEMPRAALENRIAGGDAFAGALSGLDPVLGFSTLPFLVQSVDIAHAANARARPLYEKALAARGLKLLYLTIWPATGLWSDRPLAGADDLPKLNLRAYDANSSEVMKAAGANAQFLPMDKALAGLKKHQLNAFLTSGDGGAGRKLWDFLPYFTAINYAMPVSIAFVRTEALPRYRSRCSARCWPPQPRPSKASSHSWLIARPRITRACATTASTSPSLRRHPSLRRSGRRQRPRLPPGKRRPAQMPPRSSNGRSGNDAAGLDSRPDPTSNGPAVST